MRTPPALVLVGLLSLACGGGALVAPRTPGWSAETATACDAAHADQVRRHLQRECAIEESPSWPLFARTDSLPEVEVEAMPWPGGSLISVSDHRTEIPWPAFGPEGRRSFYATPDNPRGPFWPAQVRDAVATAPAPLVLSFAPDRPMSEVVETLGYAREAGISRVGFAVEATALAPLPPADPALDEALRRALQGEAPDDERVVPTRTRSGGVSPLATWTASLQAAAADCEPLADTFRSLAGMSPDRRCATLAEQVPAGLLACDCAPDSATVVTLLQAMITGRPLAVVPVTLEPDQIRSVDPHIPWGVWAEAHLAEGPLWLEVREAP